jgi:serine/threonine protein kinase
MDSTFKPTKIGAYDVVSVIGRSGISTVLKATDRRAGRTVAIKVLTGATDDPDLLLLKFYREAKDTPKLEHPNIVTVYELGYENGSPYLVMEYLEGERLDAVIAARRPMPIAERLRIVTQICAGLSYAHQQDLVHRDIKPANVVVVENHTAKIVDFGMARLGGNRDSDTGQVVANLNYLSPEQLNGSVDLDFRTDVYSTGVVLFQMLTGVLPFEEATSAATLKKIEQSPPPPLGKYLKGCPEELEAITRKALAKNREERYASAEEFGADIARMQQHYEKQLLVDYLQSAKELMARKDFATAKQQLLQLLRRDPQNAEADDLLRHIKQAQDQQQRAQQALQLQAKAEEAFRRNELAEAIQFVEQGLQLDPGNNVLLRARDAILAAQAKMAKYREALQRAESALQSGDLEAARQSVDKAIAIQPEDPQGRRLAGQIRSLIEQQRQRGQETAQRRKKLASDIEAVEKAMADARMLLFRGKVAEALQLLEGIKPQVSQIPPQWSEQVDLLKKEAWAQQDQQPTQPLAPAPSDQGQTNWNRNADLQSDSGATSTSSLSSPNITGAHAPKFDEREGAAPARDRGLGLISEGLEDASPPPQRSPFEENPPVRPARPEGRTWGRSILWLGVAAVVLLAVVGWLAVRFKLETSSPKPAPPPLVSKPTYAAINAEPWATLREITPENGDAKSAIGLATPLRIKLPPGGYKLTLEGPNHELKQLVITVPQQGGTSGFVFFRKPDVNRVLNQ